MFFVRRYCRFLAVPMAALMFVISMPLGAVQAALVTTDQVVENSEIEAGRARIAALIMREDVQQQLRAEGVDPDEALKRVAMLSDAEVRQVTDRIDSMPAGQSVAGALIGALLIIFLVLLVTDLLGLTDVFPFVKGGRAARK